MFLASPADKHYFSNRSLFRLDEERSSGRDRGGVEKWRILLVLDTGGLSVPKGFLWYGIMWEAKGFVSTCVPYNRNKCPKHHVRAKMTKYHAGTLIERVHLDFLGPLPRTRE